MVDSFRFNTTISGSRVYSPITADGMIVNGYSLPAYISSFSGKTISYYSGSTLVQAGLSTIYHEASSIFNLTLYNNTYLVTGNDVIYNIVVPDYKT